MSRRWWFLIGGMLAIVVTAAIWLASRDRQGPKPLTDLEVAETWLQCIDCRGSFLKRIHEMPARNRDTVTTFLRAALRDGPDSARVIRFEQGLYRTWLADSLYRGRRGEGPAISFASFATRYRRGFEVMWRSRAAIGLGVIRSGVALTSLNNALQFPLTNKGDSTIHEAVQHALADTGRAVLAHFPQR